MSTAHNLALAMDEFLRLTNPEHETRRHIEAYLGNPEIPDMHPTLSTLQRLRFEAEREVERLIALMDAIDGDPDLEDEHDASHEDEAACGGAFESNFASTAAEDSCGIYAEQNVGRHFASLEEECEIVSEDEGAQCEDEGAQVDDEPLDDNGIADPSGACEQGWGRNGMVIAVI